MAGSTRDQYLQLQVLGLKFAGLWPFQFDLGGRRLSACANHFHIVFMGLNLVQLAASQVKMFVDKWGGSIDDIYLHVLEFMIANTAIIFALLLQIYRSELAHLFDVVSTQMQERSAPGLTYTTMHRSYKLSRQLTLVWIAFCVGGTIHHALEPILDGRRQLPVETWYPFHVEQSPYFEIVYVLQTIGQVQSGFVYSSVIALVFSLAILMCGQLDMLFCSIRNIPCTAMILAGDSKSMERMKEMRLGWDADNSLQYFANNELLDDRQYHGQKEPSKWTLSYDDGVLVAINECARHHSAILTVVRSAERYLRLINLMALVHLTLIICLLTYAMSSHEEVDNMLYHIIIYLCLCNTDSFLLCFHPHHMVYQVSVR